jgi:hypothetical protein
VEKEMDHAFQQEVWSKLPLNEYQRQDLLNNLIAELAMDESSEDIQSVLQETPQKKRKRGPPIEQSESPNHMC